MPMMDSLTSKAIFTSLRKPLGSSMPKLMPVVSVIYFFSESEKVCQIASICSSSGVYARIRSTSLVKEIKPAFCKSDHEGISESPSLSLNSGYSFVMSVNASS